MVASRKLVTALRYCLHFMQDIPDVGGPYVLFQALLCCDWLAVNFTVQVCVATWSVLTDPVSLM